MTKLSSISALPPLHFRESYGRPKSELQHLYIFIVTLLLDCSLLVAPSDSCFSMAILPHRSRSFVVVAVFVIVVVVVVICVGVVARSVCFWLLLFTLDLRVPPAETRLTVYCWLQVIMRERRKWATLGRDKFMANGVFKRARARAPSVRS